MSTTGRLKEKSENCQRVDVVDAAEEIGCHPEYLRRRMVAKDWDLGRAGQVSRKGRCGIGGR